MSAIESVELIGKALKIKCKDNECITFEDIWLRDHCRCFECYHVSTFQRAHHLIDIPEAIISKVENDNKHIIVTWEDNHKSIYTVDFLLEFNFKKWKDSRRLRPLLWRGDEVSNKVARVNVDKFLTSVQGSKEVFQSLLDHGVALIENVDASVEATEAVCRALGGVQHTVFGGMWKFTTNQEHADTAYTNLPLAAHNDNTYFNEAAGLQILHCLGHSNGLGGETILVDGFYGAAKLKEEHPKDYEFLTKFNIEAEYIEDGSHFRYSAPVIRVDNMNDITQIRFNVYDRSAMAFSSGKECRAYYRSLKNLSRYYEHPEFQWKFKLNPGVVMVMDNFRVLHGRTGFSGKRVLCGSYVSRSDWLNKARTLHLIK